MRSLPSDAPLDVLFYTPWIGSLLRPGVSLPTGGAETQVLLVCRELAARGHNVAREAWARGVPTLAFTHDLDGVIGGDRLGGFAGGSPSHLRELAQTLRVSREDSVELARSCCDCVAQHHSPSTVAAECEITLGLKRARARPGQESRSVGEPACVE